MRNFTRTEVRIPIRNVVPVHVELVVVPVHVWDVAVGIARSSFLLHFVHISRNRNDFLCSAQEGATLGVDRA